MLHDIAADGTVLLSRNTIRIAMMCKPPAEERERDLTWLLGSFVQGLAPDGETVIFTEPFGANEPRRAPVYSRRMDGSPAVRIGEGGRGVLSPDGKWMVVADGGQLVLVPTGAGPAVQLPKGTTRQAFTPAWLGDSQRIVFTGDSGDNRPRGYVQEIPAGEPRAFTPDGVVLAGRAPVRDDRTILARVGPAWNLFAIEGGDGRPVSGLTPRDIPVQWSPDGRYVYAVSNLDPANPRVRALDVFRVDIISGQRTLWRTLSPFDQVGVEVLPGRVALTRDGRAYCYSYMRRLGDLFVVTGLR